MIAINFRLSKKCFVFIFLLFIFPVSIQAQSASVDTVNFYSVALQKITKVVVVLPSGYNKNKKYPVLFLLHGYTGNYSNWITKVPALKKYTCKTEMIVVCPDGENSWYVNDPSGIKNQYEKYISKELVEMIDKKYATYKSSVKRAITGLSMGGHGALTIAAKHPDVFGAAGSMSGAVDMMALQKKYNINNIAGDTAKTHFNWINHSALALLDSNNSKNVDLIIDCGVDDIFIEHNRALHQKLVEQKVNHDYIERHGGHNWYYWENSLPYQMLFFKRFFEKNQ